MLSFLGLHYKVKRVTQVKQTYHQVQETAHMQGHVTLLADTLCAPLINIRNRKGSNEITEKVRDLSTGCTQAGRVTQVCRGGGITRAEASRVSLSTGLAATHQHNQRGRSGSCTQILYL